MALFDAMFEFYDDATLVGSSATNSGYDYVGTTAKTLDWIAADLEMGAGEPVWLNIRVGTTAYAPTTAGDRVNFILFADTASVSHDSDSDVVISSGEREASTLTANAWVLRVPLPVDVDTKQYLSLGAHFNEITTAGTINAWLDHGPQSSHDTQVSASNIT